MIICKYNFADPFTVFYPHQRPGNRTAFESVNYSGEYLVMNGDGTLSLSSPKGKIYEFSSIHAGKSSRYSYVFATLPSGATCYISFNGNGAPLANQCNPLTPIGLENAKVQVS